MLYLTLGHLVLVAISLKNMNKRLKLFILLLVTQLIFSSLVFLAPGNVVRGEHFDDKHKVPIFTVSAKNCGRIMGVDTDAPDTFHSMEETEVPRR